MQLILHNKTKYEVDDMSSINRLIFKTSKYSDVDKIKKDITEENLKGATLGDEVIENSFPKMLEITDMMEEKFTLTIHVERKPDTVLLQEQVTELQEVVADLGGI